MREGAQHAEEPSGPLSAGAASRRAAEAWLQRLTLEGSSKNISLSVEIPPDTLPERHFVANLAPAELRKSGASFDLVDELPEFRRNAIEGLRPTMESGLAMIVRARERVTMPARPLVIGAMNPCRAGSNHGDNKRRFRWHRPSRPVLARALPPARPSPGRSTPPSPQGEIRALREFASDAAVLAALV